MKKRRIALLLAFMLVFVSACSPATKAPEKETEIKEEISEEKKDIAEEKEETIEQEVEKEEEEEEEEEEEKEDELNLDRSAVGSNGVVAAAKPEASEVGVEIMKAGGNAIDAAVATAFALGVVEPNASGIGGGGFMMIRFAETGEVVFLDFREKAPLAATEDMYPLDEEGKVKDQLSTVGGLSVGVPGEVKGLLEALDTFGTMSREEVLKPAIDLAENGYLVTKNFENIITDNFEKINKFDATKEIYLKDGLPYVDGDILKNPDLAETLKLIAEQGSDAIYKGPIAEDIVKASADSGGILTLEDLENYEVKIREPIVGTYRDYEIVSAPPSSSGGTHVIELLNILENYDVKSLGHNTTEGLHLWSEASKLMFADRGEYMADTDFVEVPLQGLASKDYAKELAERISMDEVKTEVEPGDPSKYESGSTTHFSVMDKEGNMVAVTKTINYFFGSGVAVGGRGFMLNNEMDDFNAKPGTSNSVEPEKRPLSSMTPTFVLKDSEPYMVIGSPGATRIITTVAQIISNVIDHGMDIQDAINSPRMYDMKGTLAVEGRVDEKVIQELKDMGHEVDVKEDLAPYFGGAQCIIRNDDGSMKGGGDPRRDGQAVAY